jgi:hypothetical protein
MRSSYLLFSSVCFSCLLSWTNCQALALGDYCANEYTTCNARARVDLRTCLANAKDDLDDLICSLEFQIAGLKCDKAYEDCVYSMRDARQSLKSTPLGIVTE